MPALIVVADSITRVGPETAGAVVVNASHGGVYAAYLAAKLRAAAAIFNDAGIGRDRAGIGGLDYLQEFGMPAATVGHETARIGEGADMLAHGIITHANALAASLGVVPGQSCHEAAALLQQAQPTDRAPPEAIEGAFLLISDPPLVWALDSASLVLPEHREGIVVTGSHGGLLGGKPASAVKAAVAIAIYNDAGIGIDQAGISRLPVLAQRGIAAGCVSCDSARIGEAMSSWEDGILSAVNATAIARGGRVGQTTREFVATLLEHA
jgi:hypothetical protein